MRPVSLEQLKVYAAGRLGSKPVLKEVILSERGSVSTEEYVAKLDTWLRLFDAEGSG